MKMVLKFRLLHCCNMFELTPVRYLKVLYWIREETQSDWQPAMVLLYFIWLPTQKQSPSHIKILCSVIRQHLLDIRVCKFVHPWSETVWYRRENYKMGIGGRHHKLSSTELYQFSFCVSFSDSIRNDKILEIPPPHMSENLQPSLNFLVAHLKLSITFWINFWKNYF